MNKQIRYWWEIAPNVWKTILIGWIVVILSGVFAWEFSASGAVLVCCVIVAEFLFNQWELYPHLEESGKFGSSLSLPRYYRRRIRELSEEGEAPWQAAKRIRDSIHLVMVVNLIIGTLIWGYGHLIII